MNFRRVLLLFLAAVLLAPTAFAQARGKRLILKDGSYQAADKWEIKGDRVRYHSTERYDWEELPNSLVDWPATEKYNAEANTPTARTKAMEEEDRAEAEAENAASPLVAPGLRLPETGGVFLLDNYQGGPQLNEIPQSGTEVKKNTGKNILRATVNPIASSKQTIELHGVHASVQSHTPRPAIYINLSGLDTDGDASANAAQHQDQRPDRYKIVRAQVDAKRGMRVIGDYKISMIGKVKQEQNDIPASAEQMKGGWVKLTPTQDLAAGEYAVVEILGENEMNLYVWDFGVNPNAGDNPSAWTPKAPAEEKPAEPPKLDSRPHQ
jgi:hypothetical protein